MMNPALPESPRRKVFGIDWAKTGTTTLGRCFEILGYNHQGQNLSLVPQIMRGDFSKPSASPPPRTASRTGRGF
jgi:hypothetical protein